LTDLRQHALAGSWISGNDESLARSAPGERAFRASRKLARAIGMRITLALALTLWVTIVWTAAGQQTTAPRRPPLIINSIAGPDTYAFYCATCHGARGRGDGPTAAALEIKTPDLTSLARRSGGAFPRPYVEAFVTGSGRPAPAHGSGDMPVWGPIFRSLDPPDVRTKVRIANLVDYLESIQAR
jgi:mono/diheme cytochrome c family protein